MKDEYIIVNKTALLRRINTLERKLTGEPKAFIWKDGNAELQALKRILRQSTPVIDIEAREH